MVTFRTYGALIQKWWWEGMYTDAIKFVEKCPECTIVSGTGRHYNPSLHPIPVNRPFQIIGVIQKHPGCKKRSSQELKKRPG